MNGDSILENFNSHLGPRLWRKRKHSQMEENWERTKAKACFDNDRISDLPPEILDQILVKLPMRQAIRTSLLSREWRHQWKSLSQLCFFYCSYVPASYIGAKNLLENHERRQIDKLCLSSCRGAPASWINILSTKVVKDLTIFEHQFERYPPVHPVFFSFRQLVHLQILGCKIILPASFQGFKLLISLRLKRVIISDTHFHTLIATCSNLETLTLERSVWGNSLPYKKLIINSSSLKHLEMVYQWHEKISFENCSRITSIAIMPKLRREDGLSDSNYWDSDFPLLWFLPGNYRDLQEDNETASQAQIAQLDRETVINLLNAIASWSALERLSLPAKLFEILNIDVLKTAVPRNLLNLKTFHFTQMNYRNLNSLGGLFFILLRSPNLERLDFSVVHSGLDERLEKIFSGRGKQRTAYFNKLRYVKMKFMYAYEVTPVLELLKFIIGSSPVLEKVTLRKEGDRTWKIPEKRLKKEVEKLKQVVQSPHVMFRYEFKGPPMFCSEL